MPRVTDKIVKIAGIDRREYFRKYNQEKRLVVSINLSRDTDSDIIEAIEREGKENNSSSVKSLIREALRQREKDRPGRCNPRFM